LLLLLRTFLVVCLASLCAVLAFIVIILNGRHFIVVSKEEEAYAEKFAMQSFWQPRPLSIFLYWFFSFSLCLCFRPKGVGENFATQGGKSST